MPGGFSDVGINEEFIKEVGGTAPHGPDLGSLGLWVKAD